MIKSLHLMIFIIIKEMSKGQQSIKDNIKAYIAVLKANQERPLSSSHDQGVEPHLCHLLVHLDAQRFHLDHGKHPGVLLLPLVLRVLRPVQQLLPDVGAVHHLHDPLPRHRRELLPVACFAVGIENTHIWS